MKQITGKKKKAVRMLLAVSILLTVIFSGTTVLAAATGYHTAYHSDHSVSRQYVAPFTFYCSMCGGSGTTYRYQYYFTCNGTKYVIRQWAHYTGCGCGTWWEYCTYDTSGATTSVKGAAGMDEAGCYDSYACPGYETANTYTVKFNGNGSTGGSTASQTHTYDTAKILTANGYTRTGYTFKNWNTKADGTGTSYVNKASVKNLTSANLGTVNLYAQWTANTYKLSLNPNGGTSASAGNSVTLTYGKNYFYKIGSYSPVRTGYTFLGWYTKASGGTKVYTSGGQVTNEGTYWQNNLCVYAGNYTLYAHWQINSYTVTYDANGGVLNSAATAAVTYGSAVDLKPTAEKEGYRFVGWSTDPDAEEGLSSCKMPAENVTLYAVYSIPVSDVKELYIQSWIPGNPENYRIYPLTRTAESGMYYTYELANTNIAADFGNTPVAASLFAWDYAGNYRVIKTWYPESVPAEEPEVPEYFLQTVNHYRYDAVSQEWVLFETTAEEVMKGETYTPQYIAAPVGYREDHIDEPYVVAEAAAKGAYYSPISYTLTFDSNGGTCATADKTILFGDVYGELPAAERPGHNFLGWYTKREDGERIKSSDRYPSAGDSTVYAHWQIREYTITYDYRTNGGTGTGKESETLPYGSLADLSVTASKDGWEHIGWNTDPDAAAGLTSYTLENEDVTLYAIYRKTVTLTYVDSSGTDAKAEPVSSSGQESKAIYNRTTGAVFRIPEPHVPDGWQPEGWSLSKEAAADADVSAGTDLTAENDLTLYGVYTKEVTVSYDTNGSAWAILPETLTRRYNASGQFLNPEISIPSAPQLDSHSFLGWQDENGNDFYPGERVEIRKDTVFTATWDQYPKLTAYDRYFTLKEAQNGQITPVKLLEKVTGTDREDGILTNGTDVLVINYRPEDFTGFTADGSVTVTYRAKDSFGNTATKTITVHITDTSIREEGNKQYIRFISSDFYMDGTNYVTPKLGGLEPLSVWKSNAAYKTALDDTLNNGKTGENVINLSLFGKSYQVIQPGTGTWDHSLETWEFTRAELKEAKEYIYSEGYGNYQSENGLFNFLEKFKNNKKQHFTIDKTK